MRWPDSFDTSAVADAPAAGGKAPVAASAAKLELLDGDELVQFTIKPSLWFIPLSAARSLAGLAGAGVLLALFVVPNYSREGLIAFQVVCAAAAARVGFAMVLWASRLYVLTNRRVMQFTGVFTPELQECPLTKISGADLTVEPHQRVLRLGTIRMTAPAAAPLPSEQPAHGQPAAPPADPKAVRMSWEHISHAADIHERLVRAIRKAQSRE